MAAFLLGKGLNADEGRVKASAQTQDIAALHGKEAREGAKVDFIHPEGPGEAAHLGEHFADLVHLGFHAGVNQDAHSQHHANGKGPDCQCHSALAKLVTKNGHTCPSLL